jgi:hypothetical protein
MDPLTLALETVIIPSFAVGALLVVLMAICHGKQGPVINGTVQPLAMGVGLILGIVAVLDRVPFPPMDAQGRLMLIGMGLSIVMACLARLQSRPLWLAGITALVVGGSVLYLLPRSLGTGAIALSAVLAFVTVLGWGWSLMPVFVNKSQEPSPEMLEAPENSTEYDIGQVVGQPANGAAAAIVATEPGPSPALTGTMVLALGTAVSAVMLLGGSASFGQMAGVTCSIAGPAVVFGWIRRNWGLSGTGVGVVVGILVLIMVSGQQLATAHPVALALVALAPAGLGVMRAFRADFSRLPVLAVVWGTFSVFVGGAMITAWMAQPAETW